MRDPGSSSTAAATHPSPDEATARERICLVVDMIPPGKVATYGQIATLAGLPRRARLVGRVLATLPRDSRLPWFRVINAAGRITFPQDSASFERQKRSLQADGVTVNGGRVDLARFRWPAGEP